MLVGDKLDAVYTLFKVMFKEPLEAASNGGPLPKKHKKCFLGSLSDMLVSAKVGERGCDTTVHPTSELKATWCRIWDSWISYATSSA